MGLVCYFPNISHPLFALIFRLLFPILAIMIVGASVSIASLVEIALHARKEAKRRRLAEDIAADPALAVDRNELEPPIEVSIHYPGIALLSSVSISVLKFFYFGTALASHQFLFSVAQKSTGILYAQNLPWMTYHQAKTFIWVSIPAIVFYDFGLPLLFFYLCWKFRHSYNKPEVSIYFGSLFDNFSPQCFWWEMVNTLRKLAIALTLQAIPASDASQAAIGVSILAGAQIIQVSLNPWRRKIENLFDTISSILLITAFFFTRPTRLAHSEGSIYYIIALSLAFVLVSVAFILYKTITGTTQYEARLTQHLNDMELKSDDGGFYSLITEEEPEVSLN